MFKKKIQAQDFTKRTLMLALVKGTESVTVGKEYMVAMRHVIICIL
jgi:hypothetical protein